MQIGRHLNHSLGASCHSSTNIGNSPTNSALGFISAIRRFCSLYKGSPVFVPEGSGGHFKGRNPNVPAGELQANWVKDTCVVYIGKAGGGTSRATLRKRIGQYIRFGSGEPVGHWGGRYIWQLEDADDLLFCWRAAKESEDAKDLESKLIADFKSQYGGARPLANLSD